MTFSFLRSIRIPSFLQPGSLGLASVITLSLTLLALSGLTGCGAGTTLAPAAAAASGEVTLEGLVHGGQQPIIGAGIQLYAAGTTADQSAATPLINLPTPPVFTGPGGSFSITGDFTCPTITSEVYLIASGGNPGLALGTNNTASVLMSALGPCGNLTSATHIVINEVSTIGSIYPITPFMTSYLNVGSSSADFNTLAADFMQINEFINTDGGASPGPTLPAGFSAPVANLYSLANSMSACVNSTGGVAGDGSNCGNFLLYAKPPAGPAPTNTADAILDIANNPFQNVSQIFALGTGTPAFQPDLNSAPADWTLKILPNIMLATPSNLVGVGSTNTGTITLGQAAPAGGLTINFASDNTAAVTAVTPVNLAAGATTGNFSYTGIAAGTADLTASATGYVSSTVTLSATASLISLGTIPIVAPGQAVSLPLSLGTPAPAGGVTVNFTSANTGIATISPASVFIAAGLKVPTANPQVTGVTVGTTQINATATAYAPGAQSVNVSVTATLPATFTVPVTTPTNETLTISAPAPTGGITFNLSSANTAIFTVPSTVTIAQGATTATIAITGMGPGTAMLTASSPGIPSATSSISVNGTINLGSATVLTGKQLQVSDYFYFAAAPPSPVTATVTSGTPSVAVVSTSPTSAGSATASLPGITGTGANTFYVQGVSVGTATLTISASGYTNTTVSVTVDPSGFIIYTPSSITTTTLSANSSVTVSPAILNPSTGAVVGYGTLVPPGGVTVAVTSSTPATGTIATSPITFVANDSSENATFQPVGAGATTISIATPSGFTTPTPSSTQQITATVTAPPINTSGATLTGGTNLEVSAYAYLSQTPLAPTTVTVTSSNPAVAVVSTSPTVSGAATATFTSVVSTGSLTFYVQGLTLGTTTLTISATPYTSATINVTIDPSGFVVYNPGSINTTSLSSSTPVTLASAILNPSTLTVLNYGYVNPQVAPVSVPFASSTTSVGTLANSSVVFHAGDSTDVDTFQPVGAGATNLTVTNPAGFNTPTPAATQQIVATVTAPPIDSSGATATTGVNLEVSAFVYLSQTPTAPLTVSLISSNPAVATISTSATVAGAATTTFPNTVSTGTLSFWIQGQMTGASTITITAPGYQSTTIAVTVDPSGFVVYNPGSISTTTFSTATPVTLAAAYLNPSTLAVINYAFLNPGIGSVPVTLASSATQVGTIASPATFTADTSTASVNFQPVAAGNTTISIATPAGYSTPTPSSSQQITATVTAPPIGTSGNATTGVNLQVTNYGYLSVTPPSAVTMTMVSNNPSIATISTSATVAGTASLTFNNITNTNTQNIYIQGQALGTTTITLSAPGYSNATINVTVDPTGFVIYNPGSFSTTTFSAPTPITIAAAYLTPGTLTVINYAYLNPGVGSPQIPITSSSTSIGTIAGPATITVGNSTASVNFQPIAAGTTNLTIGTPAGYSTPSAAATQQITATVTAPPIGTSGTPSTTGVGLQVPASAYLSQTPPTATTLTVTSSNPSVAVLSTSQTVAGSAALNFTGITNTTTQNFYIQGLAVGASTLTITANGFTTATITVNVDPSGFVVYNPGNFSTTTFSASTPITIAAAYLTPGTLTVINYAALNPGGNVSVPIASSSPSVGTITTPIVFHPGDTTGTASFQPISGGSTTLSITTPAGFTTPSQSSTQQITATVSAPPISVSSLTPTIGANLQLASYAYLSVAPPAPVTVTITSNNPAIATVSTDPTVVGTAAIAFTGVSSTTTLNFSLQGQTVGSTTLTVSAPGYASATVTVTVDPSGFVIFNPGNFSTTVASGATAISITPAVLNPGVLTLNSYANINPGIGTVSVPIGSTSPQIGTISPTTLSFPANSSTQTATFTPLASGSTDIDITAQPTGFTTPSQPNTQQIVVTVQ